MSSQPRTEDLVSNATELSDNIIAPEALTETEEANAAVDEEFANRVLAEAEAFSDVDISLVDIQKLNDAFNNMLLYGGAPVYGVDLADEDEDVEDEDVDDADSVASSRGGDASSQGEPEPEDDILDWDKISDNESQASMDDDDDEEGGAHGGAEPVDKEFLAWLSMDDEGTTAESVMYRQQFDDERTATEEDDNATDTVSGLEADLQRLQLSEKDEYIANGPMPERFMAEAVANNRPNLKTIPLPQQGAYYELNDEPLWILLQLRKPGYMLSRSAIAADECRKPLEQLRSSPLIKAIGTAIDLMTNKHLEPAHIAIYYQQETQAILDAYYDGKQHTMEDGAVRLEAAYSAVTGQRQLPFREGDYSVFAARPAVSDDVDPMWRNERRIESRQRAIRKPCSIFLGRLLWQIFDLDMLCHKLERGRLSLLLDMGDNCYFEGALPILQNSTFQDPVEMLFWAQYSKYCARRFAEMPISRGTMEERKIRAHRNWAIRPTQAIEDLGLERFFEDLFLPAQTYQQNLANASTALPEFPVAATRLNGEELFAWLTRIGSSFGKDGMKVLNLFVCAFIEQYSKLPVLRKVVFDTFLELGEVTVVPIGPVLLDGFSGPQTYRIAQLLGQNPLLFLRLHQYTVVPTGQTAPIQLEFTVNPEFVVEALRMKGLFMAEDVTSMVGTMASDSFAVQRSEAFRLMAQYVSDQTIPHVRGTLLRVANQMAATLSSTELGKLCAEGPYQPTKLVITPFSAHLNAWDSSFNVAEALPVPGRCVVPGAARVCAVYLADRTSTATFVFCDPHGGVVGTVRWVSCNPNTPDGLQTHRRQCVMLLSAIRKHTPNVIAVAMCNDRTVALFRTLEDFVRDYVWPDLSVSLPIVWTSGAAGTVFRFSDLADREMTSAEHAVRFAAATARFVRDPLMELCRYFDASTKDILKFPLYVPQGADEDFIYTHLEREMSLWVSSVAFDLRSILSQSRPDLIMQFCAGLGRRKAAKIVSFVTLCGGVASREPVLSFIKDELKTPAVAENFLPTLRIEDNGEKAGEASVHPCDNTLLPIAWYPAADLLVQAAVAVSNRVPLNDPIVLNDKCPIPICWARMMELEDTARWKALAEVRTQNMYLSQLLPQFNAIFGINNNVIVGNSTNSNISSERRLDLVLDEVTAMGKSFQRRPFRKVCSRVLMKQLTNVSYFSRADILSGAAKSSELDLDPRELIVKEGDLLECSVMAVSGGQNPAIKVSTSRGLTALIPVTEAEFENDYLRREFFQYINAREEARQNGTSFANIQPPAWLRRDEVIYGNVSSCNFARCELRLRWCPAPIITDDEERRLRAEEEEERCLMEEGEDELALFRGGNLGGGGGAGSGAAGGSASSAVSSVKAISLNQHALVFRTKASRHALFRNVISNNTIERLLLSPSVDIGELLVRPVPDHPSWVMLCIKAGTDRVINWPIRECRGRSGNLYYEVPDRRLDKKNLYDSLDHCIFAFVEKMAARINQLRQHRRFYPNVEAASAGIKQAVQERREALVEESRQFAYAFAEAASPTGLTRMNMLNNAKNGANANNTSNNNAATANAAASHVPYCVLYWLNGRQRQSPVHVDHEGYYVKLKTVRSATSINGVEWFRAPDPETLSFVIKNYASQLQKLTIKARKVAANHNSLSGRGGSSLNGRGTSGGVAVAAPGYLQQQQPITGAV